MVSQTQGSHKFVSKKCNMKACNTNFVKWNCITRSKQTYVKGLFYMGKNFGYRYRVCRYQRAHSYQVYRLRNRIIFRHTMTTNLGRSDNRKFLLFKMHMFSFKNLGNFLSVFVYFSLSETLVIFNNVLVLWDANFPKTFSKLHAY